MSCSHYRDKYLALFLWQWRQNVCVPVQLPYRLDCCLNTNCLPINTSNNNNNTLIYIAPACRMTSEALEMTMLSGLIYYSSVEATPLASGLTTSRLQVGYSGFKGASWFNCSVPCWWLSACLSRRPSPATIGRHRHVLCPTDQHTVRRPELCSRWTAALEQSAGQDSPARQWHWRISSAVKVGFV